VALAPGTRLGPYEILSLLGAGGMGEVWRARDTRLGRDVAVKVIHPRLAPEPERVSRFEQEARAASQIDHPNILVVHDIGSHDGSPYIVSELLEGESLREKLGSPLPPRKAVQYAVQVAHGLAAAHEKGIVHRDLKPENLFVTKDGRIKILDFGVAKLTQPPDPSTSLTEAPTAAPATDVGVVLGTVGYMSPEQVLGKPLDTRTDLFSLGVVLYEMLSGKRPFQKESAPETMTAILKEEPPDLAETGRSIPSGLDRIMRHCLEKEPSSRFQSARDVAFDLEALWHVSVPAAPLLKRTREISMPLMVALASLSVGILAGHFLWRTRPSQGPQFHRLTFRRGAVYSARFATGGRTVVLSAVWEGKPVDLFLTQGQSPESRSLGFPGATLLALSSQGELAMLLHPHPALLPGGLGGYRGTLARVPLTGRAPHEVLEDAVLADWAPDGSALAVARAAGPRIVIEMPIGRRLYETENNVLSMRVSPDGKVIAIAEHSPGFGTNGSISIVDAGGKKTTLVADELGDYADIAWAPSGNEVWYEFGWHGGNSLSAVDLSGHRRPLLQMPDRIQLFDVSKEGQALVNKVTWRVGVFGVAPGQSLEHDFSWLDVSEVDDVSPDGSAILTTEFGEGGDPHHWSVYLRKTDGSPAVRLGDGQAMALSPDGKWALSMRRTTPPELVLWPTGPGEPIRVPNRGIADYYMAVLLRDGKGILFTGVEPGHGPRCYVEGIDGQELRPVTPEGTILPICELPLASDGRRFFAIGPDHIARVYSLTDEGVRTIPGIEPWETPLGWSAGDSELYVARMGRLPLHIDRLDLSTGRRIFWRELMPSDPPSVSGLYAVHVAPDRAWYFYSYSRVLSDLYSVDGLH